MLCKKNITNNQSPRHSHPYLHRSAAELPVDHILGLAVELGLKVGLHEEDVGGVESVFQFPGELLVVADLRRVDEQLAHELKRHAVLVERLLGGVVELLEEEDILLNSSTDAVEISEMNNMF